MLGGKRGLTMKITPLVTIVNKGKKKLSGSDFQDFNKANGKDGFLGPLALQANKNKTSLLGIMYIVKL